MHDFGRAAPGKIPVLYLETRVAQSWRNFAIALEMPRTGILSNRPSMRRPAGVKVSSFLFRGTRFYPAEPAPRAGKNVHRIAIRCTRNPALNYSASLCLNDLHGFVELE